MLMTVKTGIERACVKVDAGPSALSLQPSAFARRARRGQTAIEYLLVTVVLLVVFATLYRTLQWYLSKEFQAGGIVVMRMYKQLQY